MNWLVMNLVLGIFVTALILGVLSTGMRLEYGKRSERGRAVVAVAEAEATEQAITKVAA
ncbi:MAG: hypothetical protein M0Z88_07140 [Actinomycetota bacterium]|nr:hypothetical protein [Actinomycetota bacterium]